MARPSTTFPRLWVAWRVTTHGPLRWLRTLMVMLQRLGTRTCLRFRASPPMPEAHRDGQCMINRHLTWSSCAPAMLALVLIAGLPVRATKAKDADAMVIVIAQSTGLTDLPSSVLRDAYLGLTAEHHDVPLIPFNVPLGSAVRQRMDRALLGLEPRDVGRFWINQRVRDGRRPPRTLSSNDLALRVVAQLPGAIACVSASSVTGPLTALLIDGKGPTHPGYLLAPR